MFDISDAPVIISRVGCAGEKLRYLPCCIALADAAYYWRRLAIRNVATWISRLERVICTRPADGQSACLHLEGKSQQGILYGASSGLPVH
jgi:hypothetical protein